MCSRFLLITLVLCGSVGLVYSAISNENGVTGEPPITDDNDASEDSVGLMPDDTDEGSNSADAMETSSESDAALGEESDVALGEESDVALGEESDVALGEESDVALGEESDVTLGEESDVALGEESEAGNSSDEDEDQNNLETGTDEEETADGDEEDNSNVDDNGNNDSDVVLRRKRRAVGREFLLSKNDHPLEATLVMLDTDHRRVKRTSYNKSVSTWPNHIPYIFDSSYDKDKIYQLEQVLKFIESRVCVQFKHEQGFDSNNPNWFKEHGYSTNAYIRFRTKPGCAALYGRGHNDEGGRDVSPCNQLVSMMHEVIHSLGGIHAQNYPNRERYITLHEDNIKLGNAGNFRKYPADSDEVEYENFDPTSLLMYPPMFFTKNGLNTYDFLRPEMGHLKGHATYNNILFEISKNYKCQEKFCKDEDPDCGIGYLGYVNKKCACVCPTGFDSSTRCKELVNSASKSLSWPDTPYSLFKAEECPAGTEEGTVPLTVKRPPRMTLKKLSSSGKTLNIGMCTKTSENVNFDLWPMGTYCIGKVKDVPCGAPFEEGKFSVTTKGTMALTGSVGDVSVNGNTVTMNVCCQSQGDYRFPMKLPTDKPFRLLLNGPHCQEVEGAWALRGKIILKAKGSKSGSAPNVRTQRNVVILSSCYYSPAKYGCSQQIKLDPSNPTASITVPMDGGSRESNKRCFYFFEAPENSRLRLTINEMKLHPRDRFLVKRFNLLENPVRVNPQHPTYQMITEKNVLMVEYWSFFKSESAQGASFTVDLLSPEGLCYNAETQGADYAGNKEVSETYEECVPWRDATSCPDFPWTGTNGLHLLNSCRSCRNLDTVGMLQPWCYTFVNGTTCVRRYCDVCNEADPVDKLQGCDEYINSNPSFCSDALGRFGCFKSCGMNPAPYNADEVKCDKPVIPSGLTTSGDLQESYNVGAKVTVSCNGQDTEIECTTHGWTPFDDQCTTQQCVDASQLCQNALSKFPEFCTDDNSKAVAEKNCKKSCGLCDAASCSPSGGASYSLVSAGDVSSGQKVTYQCNDGLHHVSGDLERGCSVSGTILGEEPVCEAKPQPKDINIEQIGEKNRYTRRISAYLMLGHGLDVPFDGKVTRWYYYCRNNDPIVLLVYRKTGKQKVFKLVGFNKAKCVSSWPWSHHVPANEQISVKKGDVLAVYSKSSSIVLRPCGAATERNVPLAMTRSRRVKRLMRKKRMKFLGKGCGYLAIGARVEPN